MNWYKKANQNNEWSFPEAEHDYNPNWDYDVDPLPDQELVKISETIINEINTQLVPNVGIGICKAAYIKAGNTNDLAKYINGTQPNPVFVIDLQNIKTTAEELARSYNADPKQEIYIGIKTTLFHELGHAIQDWMNLEFDEDEAERFGNHLYETGQLWKFWE